MGIDITLPEFRQNNVAQCWHCTNRDGVYEGVINGYRFLLPYCEVMHMAMTEVFHSPCDRLNKK